MSANNYLLIKEVEEGHYSLSMNFAEEVVGGDGEIFYYGVFDNAEKAMRRADEIMREEIIEYGVAFEFKDVG